MWGIVGCHSSTPSHLALTVCCLPICNPCALPLSRFFVCCPHSHSGILPVLKPIFEGADGEVLLALVKHMGVFYNLMPRWVGGWAGVFGGWGVSWLVGWVRVQVEGIYLRAAVHPHAHTCMLYCMMISTLQ